jgi:hypothetical protein
MTAVRGVPAQRVIGWSHPGQTAARESHRHGFPVRARAAWYRRQEGHPPSRWGSRLLPGASPANDRCDLSRRHAASRHPASGVVSHRGAQKRQAAAFTNRQLPFCRRAPTLLIAYRLPAESTKGGGRFRGASAVEGSRWCGGATVPRPCGSVPRFAFRAPSFKGAVRRIARAAGGARAGPGCRAGWDGGPGRRPDPPDRLPRPR